MSTEKPLGKLESLDLRTAWRHEAGDFTPWLAREENLRLLAETLKIPDLELMATEHYVGEFKLDILCSDGESMVIIENQLDETDHKHLGQIIAYAAGVDAQTIIWVAEKFRKEHRAALQYLNDNTTENIAFFGVEIELWRIDESAPAPKFEVVVQPNDWTKVGREQARVAASTSATKQLQYEFWIMLVDAISKQAPEVKPQKPRPQHWLTTSIGRSGFNLNFTANTRDCKFGVELWLHGAEAKSWFAVLSAQRAAIEQSLGFELDWQKLPDKEACRIATSYDKAPLGNKERWNEYVNWLIQRVRRMDQVLRPKVRELQ